MSESIIFSGNGVCVADSKGRFSLPLEMRKTLIASSADNKLYMTVHPELPCAVGFWFSHKQWLEDQVVEMERAALEKGLPFNADAERENRFADVEGLNFDSGGRFSMPDDICEILDIDDAVVFIGASRHIQMWRPETFLASEGRTPRARYAVEKFLAERKAGKRK